MRAETRDNLSQYHLVPWFLPIDSWRQLVPSSVVLPGIPFRDILGKMLMYGHRLFVYLCTKGDCIWIFIAGNYTGAHQRFFLHNAFPVSFCKCVWSHELLSLLGYWARVMKPIPKMEKVRNKTHEWILTNPRSALQCQAQNLHTHTLASSPPQPQKLAQTSIDYYDFFQVSIHPGTQILLDGLTVLYTVVHLNLPKYSFKYHTKWPPPKGSDAPTSSIFQVCGLFKVPPSGSNLQASVNTSSLQLY